jgi:transcription initiation factor TFIIB
MLTASDRGPVLDRRQQCPRCGKRSNFVTDRLGGQVVCGDCGMVVQDRTEETGAVLDGLTTFSIAKPDMGLATVMGSADVNGSASLGPSMGRLRMWDRRSQAHSGADSSLKRAMGDLEKLAQKVAVSDAVVERAAYIYRKSIPLISTRGRSITTLVAAALYAGCRSTRTPRTLKDIGDAANLDRLDIARSYRLLVTENDLPQPVDDPSRSLSRIACAAGLNAKVERRGLEILRRAEQEGALTGNSPMGSAAAALYIASVLEGDRTTKTHVAMVAGVTKVTIRNRCRVLVSSLGLDPESFDDIKARRKDAPSSLTDARRG